VTELPVGKGIFGVGIAALRGWGAWDRSDGQDASRLRAWWGMVFSLGLHAAVIGLAVALSVAGIRREVASPPVLMDVVFGAPGGDGSPGDGAPGEEGAAGGSGAGPKAETLPSPPVAAPRPTVAVADKAGEPQPARPVRKKRTPPRPVPARASSFARGTGESAPAAVPAAPAADAAGLAGGARRWPRPAMRPGLVAGNRRGRRPGSGSGQGRAGPWPRGWRPWRRGVEGEFGAGNGPTFARRVPPEYPPQARRFGREGVGVLRLMIDDSGKLTQAEIVKQGGGGIRRGGAFCRQGQQLSSGPAGRPRRRPAGLCSASGSNFREREPADRSRLPSRPPPKSLSPRCRQYGISKVGLRKPAESLPATARGLSS